MDGGTQPGSVNPFQKSARCSRALLAIGAFILGSLSIAGCGSSANGPLDSDLLYKNWHPEARYVGRQACQECHADKVETFERSQMGRSWKKASLSLSNANFETPPPVFDPNLNLYYQPFHRGEDLFVREYRVVDGDTVHNRVEQIDYIVGSGHHTNSHIYSQNGFLYQIPVTWYAQEGHWGLAPGFEKLNDRFSRPIPEECMTCHNGISPSIPGSENRFYSVASGIGCERCHGPGSVHIEAMKLGRAVDVSRQIDYTIVNPGKLSPELEMDLCARCHMQAVDVFRDGVRPDDFRPGQALSDVEHVFWPRQPDSVEVFNMASHPDRLGMSKCFISTWRADSGFDPLTCTTCHNPHEPIESKGADFFDSVCQTCHEASQIPACSEPTVVSGESGQNCWSCHMPTSSTEDIPHVSVTDHFIRIPRGEEPAWKSLPEDERNRIIRMASLVRGDVSDSDLALGFLNFFEKITNRPEMLDMADAALKRARAVEPEESLAAPFIQLWYLQQDYNSIRRFVRSNQDAVPNEAWTYFRIGEAFVDSGEFPAAVDYLNRAVNRAPGHLRFRDRLAVTYTSMGQHELAISVFNELLGINPTFEPSVNNLGFAHLSLGDFEAAERYFLDAIALNPDAEVALANLASLYFNTGRKAEAIPLARRLLDLAPSKVEYQQFWELVTS